MPGTITPSASEAQTQSPKQTKKLAHPKRQAVSSVKTLPPLQFTDLEIRVALAFRKFDHDDKKSWAETFERVAEDYQLRAAARRPARSLRLVVGGAK